MAETNGRRMALFSFGLTVAAVAVTVVVMLAIFRRATDGDAKPLASPLNTSAAAEAELKAGEISAKEGELEERKTLARLARDRFASKLKQIEADIADLDEEIKLWKSEIEPLLTSEGGRRIASSEKASETFFVIYSQERPDANQVNDLRRSLETIRTQVGAGDKTATDFYQPGEAIQKEASLLGDDAKQLKGSLRDSRRNILALMSAGRPAEVTLQERIDALAKEANDRRADAIAKAKAAEFERQTEKLAAAEAELVRRNEQAKIAAVEKKAQEASELLQLDAVRNNAAMLKLLHPLTSSGKKQPNGKTTLDGKPVSYSLLAGGGFLTEDEASLERFGEFLYSTRSNDRPTWPVPFQGAWRTGGLYRALPEASQNQLRQVQAFVRENGLALVKLGLLDS